jgi:hypothetical protein
LTKVVEEGCRTIGFDLAVLDEPVGELFDLRPLGADSERDAPCVQ